MAYLVRCPFCDHGKRVDRHDYDPSLRAVTFKFPDGGSYEFSPSTLRCAGCGEVFAFSLRTHHEEDRACASVKSSVQGLSLAQMRCGVVASHMAPFPLAKPLCRTHAISWDENHPGNPCVPLLRAC